MTLQEAIKSGRPFKRPNHSTHWDPVTIGRKELESRLNKYIKLEDFLANDWEIEKEIISLTESHILHSLNETHKLFELGSPEFEHHFCSLLGFKD